MYPGPHALQRADQPAIVMGRSGETITYRELEARSNRLAHLLRAIGLKRLDHYAIFMENHPRFIECCAAGERSSSSPIAASISPTTNACDRSISRRSSPACQQGSSIKPRSANATGRGARAAFCEKRDAETPWGGLPHHVGKRPEQNPCALRRPRLAASSEALDRDKGPRLVPDRDD